MKYILLLLSFYVCEGLFAETVAGETIPIGMFSSGDITGWESRQFERKTEYSLADLDGIKVLKAFSNQSASGLFKNVTVNLKEYPYINWRWRAADKLLEKNETLKTGDDYVARLYVMRSGGVFFWNTKALNYVWSSQKVAGRIWPNAFAPDNNRMIAVRTAHDQTGQWYTEKRNVYEDFKQWLGDDVQQIHAVAIMTDTDNTHSQATAYYGDIYFSKE